MSVIFGPVPSRRLGRSLGIDIVPLKCCSFDCVYCEVGKTTCHTFKRAPYVKKEVVKEEFEKFLKTGVPYDTITFSGSGEPTLNSDLGDIVKYLKDVQDKKIALLTNSSLLDDENLINEIKDIDLILPSLDAVSEDIVKRLNRPAQEIDMNKIVEGLYKLKKVMTGQMFLEVLIVPGYNDTEEEWKKLKEAIDYINPDWVDINTVVRPSRTMHVEGASYEVLKKFKDLIGEKGRIIAPFKVKGNEKVNEENLEERLRKTLEIRPCNIKELSSSLSVDEKELSMILKEWIINGIASSEIMNGEEFFYIKTEDTDESD